MVHCVVCSRQFNKSCSSYHAFLVAILNVLDEVQQLALHDLPGLKPACSLIRCCSIVGAILFSIILS